MQCQKVQNNCQIILKRVETDVHVALIVFYHIHAYTVTISYSPLYMNQVPEMLMSITKYIEVYLTPLLVLKIT